MISYCHLLLDKLEVSSIHLSLHVLLFSTSSTYDNHPCTTNYLACLHYTLVCEELSEILHELHLGPP